MKRVGIYGGSFAPPHKGHLKSALSFYDECALDELYILPAGEPPHKTLQGNAGPEERFFMTELTFSKEKSRKKLFFRDSRAFCCSRNRVVSCGGKRYVSLL